MNRSAAMRPGIYALEAFTSAHLPKSQSQGERANGAGTTADGDGKDYGP